DCAGVNAHRHPCKRLLLSCAVFGTSALMLATAAPGASAAPTITEFPNAGGIGPGAMTLGPDDNVWFIDTAANRIVRMAPDGSTRVFGTAEGLASNAGLAGITAGP